MKKYQLSLHPEACLDWTVNNALRDCLQNFLDSPAAFVYSYENEILELTSTNTQLAPSVLLTGYSTKREDPNSLGRHGDGLKVLLLVLIRNGIDVEIKNGDVLWKPTFEFIKDFGQEMLVVHETPLLGNVDHTIVLKGIDEATYEQMVEECLYLQEDLGTVYEGATGRVLMNKVGKLFVGGLFVCDIPEHKVGYDFKPSAMKLDRDRKTVRSFDVQWETSRLLQSCNIPVDNVVSLIKSKSADVNYVENHLSSKTTGAVYEDFKKEHGENAIVVDNLTAFRRYESHQKNVILSNNLIYNSILSEHKDYRNSVAAVDAEIEKEVEPEKSPLELLEDWYESDAMEYSDEFEVLIDSFRERGIKWAN